ncbi:MULTISPECIES: sigma factor-like helix-turn-helix DNA-binding protein [unclassified Bradyrhizobium]|uniref:sigma factor-like helix-turn-helix DNA-binding protein n=1 Tax=unclassified Bradyrhizobium TaxID=2631580 RepID=UPI0039658B13
MARPLTKTEPDGSVYRRPAAVERQVDSAVQLTLADLRRRLLVTDRDNAAYLGSESLVHLLRHGRRSGDQALMTAVLPILLGRCEANLFVTVPDGRMPDAASLRQHILDELTELIVLDGLGENPDELDFYECRFNKAFRTLRIDAVRRAARRDKEVVDVVALPPSEAKGEPDAYEDAFARVSDAFKVFPTQEWDAFREPFVNAIEALPPDQREAVILVHVLGYKEESADPNEETAATRCNCTGRTIRNRLARAAGKLARFKEDL